MAEQGRTKYDSTPDYYKRGDKDLYDVFIERYGLTVWRKHVIMEAIQYLDRAEHKASMAEDIKKVITICERILVEENH